MKKTTLLLAAAWMLLLLFVPEPARADVDYLREPFTIETTTTSTSYIRFYRSMVETSTATVKINLEYRMKTKTTGDWSDWGDWTTVAEKDVTSVTTMYSRSITLTAGTSYMIQFRGINDKFSTEDNATQYNTNTYQIFPQASGSTTWNLTMYGNIMSLLVGYDSDNEATAKTTLAAATVIPCEYCFHGLFMIYGSSYTKSNPYPDKTLSFYAPLIDATNLFFPATGLKNNCYKNLFSNMAGKTNGLQHGPTFLATSFTDENGTAVDNTFNSAFMQCNSLQSARFSFTSCPTGNNFTTVTVYTTPDNKTLYAPAGFNPTSCSIGTWNGGHTVWSYDPSAEPGGGDEPGGGEEEIVSNPATVTVRQDATTDKTEILYAYPSSVTASDNKPYGLVDMGYGVIWADRNVGASSANGLGDYYNYGGTEPIVENASCTYLASVSSMQAGDILADDDETAKVIMGNNWHMPTKAEWQALLDNTTYSGTAFTSKADNTTTLTLPTGGFYGEKNIGNWYSSNYVFALQATSNGYYWSSEFTQAKYDYGDFAYALSNAVIFSNEGSDYVVDNEGYVLYGAQVRAIYEPSFTTHTLTVKAGDHYYHYICQEGQEVTVTAVPDEMQEFKWWSDNHTNTNATCTFTVVQDMEVEAVFKLDSSIPQHTATFRNWDGTELYQVDVAVGAMPVYAGSTPTKTDWFFNGWSPAISVMGDADVVYTATFRDLESAPANVNIYQGMTADTMKILYNLDPKTGADDKTYIPVDMGYGVAWADRNVGATSTTNVGTYFQWGSTKTTFTAGTKNSDCVTMGTQAITLTDAQDAAYVNVGTRWKMPTSTEWSTFLNNTTQAGDGGTFRNKTDASKSIFLPASGYWISGSIDIPTARVYRSRNYTYSSMYAYGSICLHNYDGTYRVENKDRQNNNSGYYFSQPYYAMPVRAIYVPSYTTYTLTINVGTKKYQYICQAGQEVTVTANATTDGYVFDEWKLENGNTDATDTHLATRTFTMTGNITRTATFKEVPTGSTISIVADNTGYGSVDVDIINNVPDNTPITVNSNTLTINNTTVTATPTAVDALYTYTFTGWYNDATEPATQLTGNTNTVTDDITITAHFTRTLDLYDNQDATYYNNIKALDGQTYDVTYHRSVAYTSDNGNARWYTLCLPFNVDQSQLDLNGLTGKVYEYRYAEGSADENDHVTFHFRAVKSPNYMLAGQGYLVKATSTMPSEYTFANVTLNTATDVADGDVNDLKETNAYKESGKIAIVGVLRNGTLHAVGKQVMGLANNKIWYPHTSGNPMPAYRAYFYNPNASASVMPRVRIVVEGEGETELEVVDGELYDARGNNAGRDVRAPRKYIRNGVLIIERNGVTYDAQGKRL
ncbi:MAG: hypothetical protein IJ838_04085 [Paludibacteraceae bacterium]|nr:hypothetical protein [Paludibacteraceae bacterium]